MTITLDDVNKVAKLASLKIDESESKLYLQNLQSILSLANQMETVNTESIQAIAHCFDIKQRIRPDKVTEINSREHMQQLTKSVKSGLYCVPPVIE